MRLYRLALLLTPLALVAQTKDISSPQALYAKSEGSVVTILTFDANRAPLGQGSGFIVGKNRIVTNYHVIVGSTAASVIFNDGTMAAATSVTAGSAPKDLVIIEAETGARTPLTLGDELKLRVGETVYAIGAPKGLAASLSSGLVSAFREDEGQFLIQITAVIAPGSSGGPLLNTQGQVVGVTTSRLKDGGFAFAVGSGDLQHLLKAPLGVKVQLSDLISGDTDKPTTELSAVQGLFDQKKYDEAHASFNTLPDPAKTSFDGQLLLCRIEEQRKEYRSAIQACDIAIGSEPKNSAPYGTKALALLMLGDIDQAEGAASKAEELSDQPDYKNLLGLIHYSQEKYELVPKELPSDSNNAFVLALLAGAAFHNRDYDSYRRFLAQVTSIKGTNNGWELFTEGLAAERDLNWDLAVEKYRKCDADSDFIDPICLVAVVSAEARKADYSAAKSDVDIAISRYPKNRDVLSEGMFINLLVGNPSEADRLHEAAKMSNGRENEVTECLYYYGRNQPLLATSHCQSAIRDHENDYVVWSNAGYVALDNNDFQSARSYFAKATQLFYASKQKRTVTQVLDISWGAIAAEYYTSDKKAAKNMYHAVKKQYPQFVTIGALKQLPLVWSDNTSKLIERITSDFK
jgi:tetratricopeptide (TPR) repeat protein